MRIAGMATRAPMKPGHRHADQEVDGKGQAELQGEDGGSIGAEGIEGGLGHREQAGEADQQVEGGGEDAVDADHHQDVQDIFHVSSPPGQTSLAA